MAALRQQTDSKAAMSCRYLAIYGKTATILLAASTPLTA
nr:MAG TPA: hypothetical protein [Caudoviricetes sp.]